MSPALRRFFWRYPAWWTMALAGWGWLYLGVSWLDEHAAHRQPQLARSALHWLAMVAAMMLPLMWGHVSLIAQRSLWRRRHRAIALFLASYAGIWLLFGFVAIVLFPTAGRPLLAAATLVVAALWQVTPWKRLALLACHRTVPLAPVGWRADLDCLRYGCNTARTCVTSCWALMLACAAGHHAFWLMTAATVFVVTERMADRPRHLRFAGALFLAAMGVASRPFLDRLVELRLWQ